MDNGKLLSSYSADEASLYSQRTLTADTTPSTSRANFNAVGTIPDGWCNNGDSSIVSEVSS